MKNDREALIKELNEIIKKQKESINNLNNKLLAQESTLKENYKKISQHEEKISQFKTLMNAIERLVKIRAAKKPFTKFKNYKNLLKVYYKVKKALKASKKRTNHELLKKIKSHKGVIAYDKDWQYPAITEQYAFSMMQHQTMLDDSVYIAFPWATLIDKLDKQSGAHEEFLDILDVLKNKIKNKKRVITVCQHINLMTYQYLFIKLGITDIFWTHAVKDQSSLPKDKNINIYPFPLYPVQAIGESNIHHNRKYLYSFIGARANQWYLTQSRNYILDLLSKDDRGLVIGRDTWHYNKVVYDHQIEKTTESTENLINNKSSEEFKDIIKQSIFSLCPSGSGPNSIRLWESIGLGAIPVILADTYLPPGNIELWNEAVVFCEETEEAIKELPKKLEKIAMDDELLERKRHAMKQLWMIYGPDCFIYDIQKLLLSNVE